MSEAHLLFNFTPRWKEADNNVWNDFTPGKRKALNMSAEEMSRAAYSISGFILFKDHSPDVFVLSVHVYPRRTTGWIVP